MQQRQFKHYTANALTWGLVATLMLLIAFFGTRYYVNLARTAQYKTQALVELTQQAQLIEDDVTNQTFISDALVAFLAADVENLVINPKLSTEIERFARILATRSSLVKHVIIATGDPNQNQWRSSFVISFLEPANPDLAKSAALFTQAQSLGTQKGAQTQITTIGSQQYLLSAKAVYRKDVLWGYVFIDIALDTLLKNFRTGLEQLEFQTELEFAPSSVRDPNMIVEVPVKSFGEGWRLVATSQSNWANPFISVIPFVSIALVAALVVGGLVYYSRLESRKANWLAYYDGLTGVGNRRYLEFEFQKMAARGGFGLLLFNIDNFKAINETYGFTVGDQVLIEVADRISQLMSPNDVMARLGNDEFVVLSRNTNQEAINELSQRVQHTMSDPLLFNKNIISLITNVGSSLYPLDDTTLSGLIEHADHHAMR